MACHCSNMAFCGWKQRLAVSSTGILCVPWIQAKMLSKHGCKYLRLVPLPRFPCTLSFCDSSFLPFFFLIFCVHFEIFFQLSESKQKNWINLLMFPFSWPDDNYMITLSIRFFIQEKKKGGGGEEGKRRKKRAFVSLHSTIHCFTNKLQWEYQLPVLSLKTIDLFLW